MNHCDHDVTSSGETHSNKLYYVFLYFFYFEKEFDRVLKEMYEL